MNALPRLISHSLCPYVQRVAIVLEEKGIAFERVDIDLANKPDWFLAVSPLGKTPVLLVDAEAIFESSVICEYLDETSAPRLHPDSALQRARHRAWMEFGSAILNDIGAFYRAPDIEALSHQAATIRARFEQVEAALGDGGYFSGGRMSMVDAVFGPIFRYFDVFDDVADFAFFKRAPRVQAWRGVLRARQSVRNAAPADYAALLRTFLLRRNSALSRLVAQTAGPAARDANFVLEQVAVDPR
ncbi:MULTISPECIES: glutathione S-transferase family protein [unclassified Janthinobacterium]|uniref:glutathione S-transferase family protein n=1 Tax=unclassified Janthinobacterium TaxID=2610881 RepID=UPI00036A87EB|nr:MULTISPECIES: glutathione S-transferase family protein [unclassified Janthinobacterium]MEC5163129.1 glutathione S-transferase [Janthinobacterium sp. CG_S6]